MGQVTIVRQFVVGFAVALTLFLTGCSTTAATTPCYNQRPEVQAFIDKMVTQHGFDRQQLVELFSHVNTNPRIITTIAKPHETLPWYRYRNLFVTPARIQAGADFWRQNATTLAAAQKQYGVPAEIIVAIVGVETNYGRFEGTYCVLNALSTLAFDYGPRAPFFRSELEQYLLLTREMSLDPLSVNGSYAGAIGEPQFMPSSYRRYGVDTDHKGYCDLRHNTKDVIFSVANYFKGYGWATGQPIAMLAKSRAASPQPAGRVLPLEGPHCMENWLVFHNFDVIMRYNTSPRYAMAVTQLSEAIKTRYLHQAK